MFPYLLSKTLPELLALQVSVGAAYERLAFGNAVRVIVDQNGERVEFQSGNSAKLGDYLRMIGMAIQSKQGCTAAPTRPLSFMF